MSPQLQKEQRQLPDGNKGGARETVIPIPNQQNLCFLLSAVHLLIKDKQFARPGNLGPRYADVLVVARSL